jgi:hypothetical protein
MVLFQEHFGGREVNESFQIAKEKLNRPDLSVHNR